MPSDQHQLQYDLRERLKELTGIYSLIELANEPRPIDEMLRIFTVEIVPRSMQHPEQTFSVVILDGVEYSGCHNVDHDCELFLEGPIIIGDMLRGRLVVGLTDPSLEFLEMFEQKLIDAYAYQISKIVERRETTRQLQREKDRAEHYFAIAGVMLVVINRDKRVEMINRRGCEILGRDEADIVGRDWFESFVPPEVRVERSAAFSRRIAGEQRQTDAIENEILSTSGERRIISWRAVLLRNDRGDVVGELSSGEDITERKRIEAEKIEAEKTAERSLRLASLGTLASGVAHEINQPLTALKTQADGLLFWEDGDKPPLREELIEGLRFVSAQAERINEIIRHMRSLIQPDTRAHLQQVDIRNTLDRAVKLIRQQMLSHSIDLRQDYLGRDILAPVNSVLLEQAVINLVVNAMHALDDSDQADKRILIRLRRARGKVVIDVEDNGPGIDRSIIDQVFDPFFTTKGPHRGLGLGLTITENFIRSMGGAIHAGNLLPSGARFRIELPVGE